ncbi:MAG: mechanosensitive ion channel family protein [Candidatus Eisenbacteria bacterium]|nr:mechanosensitive ion channel family protein [Candidatus Eisenbacteria bacterium]
MQNLRVLLVPAIVLVITFLSGYVVRKVVFRSLTRWARNTKTQLDDIIISSTQGPFIVWFLILGLFIAIEVSALPAQAVGTAEKVLMVLAVLSVTATVANVAGKLIGAHAAKADTALPAATLTQNVSRIVIFTVGLLIILNGLGIAITPILATLGIGGLAVALALQDTLANLFAGLHIIAAKQIRVGDYVKLQTGEEGYVTDINWRTTRIRMLANNIVLVPNDTLAKSVVTNYYLPETDMSVLVQVGVHYNSDLRRVEAVTCEVGREVMKEVKGGVADFEPFIRYHTFNESSIDFSVILRARELVDQYVVKHEFIKRLHARYAQEGIVIPFPISAVNFEQEKQ